MDAVDRLIREASAEFEKRKRLRWQAKVIRRCRDPVVREALIAMHRLERRTGAQFY